MSGTIWPFVVQAAFGLWNLTWGQWLVIRWSAIDGLPGQAATEDIRMFARMAGFSSIGRAAAIATVVAVALTAVEPSLAQAGSAPAGKGASAVTATGGATDISARRRYYGGGGAAAAGAFAAIVGTGLAIAATQNRRAYYGDSYGGGPVYYGGGNPYYGGGNAYYGGYGNGYGLPYNSGHPVGSAW
jgi:hypothetical protein